MSFRIKGKAADGRAYSFLMNLEQSRVTDIEIANHIAAGKCYEEDVSAIFCKILRPGDAVVDVGANVGWFTLLASALVGSTGRVFACEPGKNNIPKLKENIALNPDLAHVRVFVRPISDKSESVTFHLNADGSGGNALWDPGLFETNQKSRDNPQSETLHSVPLDFIIPKPCRPRLIKINTEGAEQKVLQGALWFLNQVPAPFIVAEMHEFGLSQFGHTQESLRNLMRAHGYYTFAIFKDGSMPSLIPPGVKISSNFICNVMFAKLDSIAECWPEVDPFTHQALNMRPIECYGVRK